MGNLVNRRFTIKEITDLLRECEESLKHDVLKEQSRLHSEEQRLAAIARDTESSSVSGKRDLNKFAEANFQLACRIKFYQFCQLLILELN